MSLKLQSVTTNGDVVTTDMIKKAYGSTIPTVTYTVEAE